MISDDELLRGLSKLLQESRRVESDLVAHIGEVEHRRLFVRYASSMFVYVTEFLHFSEHEAYLRIGVARAARKHPIVLEILRDGRLHLSGIARLAPLLTEANRESVLARASGMSKREIEELVAELSPKDDVPATIRKLPDCQEKTKPNRLQQLDYGKDVTERYIIISGSGGRVSEPSTAYAVGSRGTRLPRMATEVRWIPAPLRRYG